jgi:hypothetical protein
MCRLALLCAHIFISQISKLLGARVVAVTRGADKAAYLQRLGAVAVIDTAAAGAAGQRLHKLVAAAAPNGMGLDDVCVRDGGGRRKADTHTWLMACPAALQRGWLMCITRVCATGVGGENL